MSAFDGVRGLASLAVCTGHIFTFWTPHDRSAPWPAVGLNYLGPVTLFFVLSGFSLSLVYGKDDKTQANGTPHTWQGLRTFLARRFARLAPIYYFSHLLALPIVAVYSDATQLLVGVPVALLGLQSFTLVVGNQWNSSMWQVSALLFCYTLFPSVLAKLRKRTTSQLWQTVGAMWAVSIAIASLQAFVLPSALLLGVHMFALLRVPHFVMGVAAGLIALRAPTSAVPSYAADVTGALVMADLIACALLTEATRPDFSAYFLYCVCSEFVFAGVFAVLLMGLAVPGRGGATKRLLSLSPLRYMGSISYSLYALHWPVLFLCGWASVWQPLSALGAHLPKQVQGDAEFGLGVWFAFPSLATLPLLAVCVAAAVFAHFFVEIPFGRYLRRFSASKDSRQSD